MTFLGRIGKRLHDLLADTRSIIVPPVSKWILKGCDINKDIEIDTMTQLTFIDLQMPHEEKALRAYVKVIGNNAYLRAEKSIALDKLVEEALENLRTSVDLDKDFLASD